MTRARRNTAKSFAFKVMCPYCGKPAEAAEGRSIYPHRPDLALKHFWSCQGCDAYVGCHVNGWRPLGRLANAELRSWKGKAHDVFDVMWRAKWRRDHCDKHVARNAAYAWLAVELGITREACHIGEFDVEACKRVVAICAPYAEKLRKAA